MIYGKNGGSLMLKGKFLVCDDDKNIVEVLSNTGEEINVVVSLCTS